jgi:hypothetical protein
MFGHLPALPITDQSGFSCLFIFCRSIHHPVKQDTTAGLRFNALDQSPLQKNTPYPTLSDLSLADLARKRNVASVYCYLF